MFTRDQKERFVKEGIKSMKSYSSIGVIQLNGVPDRLLQKSKNMFKDTKFLLGRKSLLEKVLDSNEDAKQLAVYLTGTSAIIMSNEDPFKLYNAFASNSLKLKAKPNQTAPEDIEIKSGDTALQPGQAVTELKQAGIDVQIQKGKVVIAKEKTIKKGELITTGISKALNTLGIAPFTAVIEPIAIMNNKLLLKHEVLSLTPEKLTLDISKAFNSALQLSLAANIVNMYTVKEMITKAYNYALFLGIEYKISDSGIVEKLIERAALQGMSLEQSASAEQSNA